MIIDDGELVLLVDGMKFSGWEEVRLTRGVERMPSDFDLKVTESFPGELTQVVAKPFSECAVEIGGDRVLTGYVDRYEPSISARSHSVRISGRGKCQDLVDCSAYLRKLGNQLNRTTLKALATELCSLFGIKVFAPDGDGPQIPQFNINLTESCWDVIERVARFSGLLAYEDAHGDLLLRAVGTEAMASGMQEGRNVEDAVATFSADGRYSFYETVLIAVDILADTGQALGSQDYNYRARAEDEGVPRFRPKVFVSEQAQYGDNFAQKRVNWECNRRWGRSQAAKVTVDSWRDAKGRLWEPNTCAAIDLPTARLPKREWVISEVSFSRGARGTRADLVLMPAEAFLPEPVVLQPFDWQVAQALAETLPGAAP